MSESGFDRVLIHGKYFPPQSSIIAVLSKIGRGKVSLNDAEIAKAMMLFCELSNTCIQQRIRGDIPPHCYTKFSYKLLRYCLPLLRDWQLDPTDLAAQARAMEQLQNSRVSNLPTKKGRKAA